MTKSKKIVFIVPIVLLALASFTYKFYSDKESSIDKSLMANLAALHYAPKDINDAFSEEVYKQYIKAIDGSKKFLTQEDVDALEKYKHSVDDDINSGKLDFFDKATDIVTKRIEETQNYYKEILDKPFAFTGSEFNSAKEEQMETDSKKLKHCKNKTELKESWKKYLKYLVMSNVYDLSEAQDKAHEKSDTVKIKSMEQLEIDARKKVNKTMTTYFKNLKGITRTDRLSSYFNCITDVFDPHTNYLAPKDKAEFDASMSGQFFGIGAQLQVKDDYVQVKEIILGSASYKQGQLKADDIILKVAQGAEEAVDIANMRLDDVVQLIRGKKGTEVRLTIKKPDGSTVIIPILRDVVVIEDSYAKSVILKGKRNIGYIYLPGFYADFNGNGGRTCSKDIRIELEKLKKANVDGIILDLRYNGGGSLNDVVDMAGLFIDKGPMVQVKERGGRIQTYDDRDAGTVYDGPLSIMVNSGSASASEIMAAAIQDYKRGLIIGTSPATYGKGTVQRVYDLDNTLTSLQSGMKPLGSAKITCQKFYRVNGGTTQLRGVIPDIVLPDPYYLLDRGEKETDYPLTWDEIPQANYKALKPNFNIEKLRSHSADRLKKNEGFAMLEEAAKRVKRQKDSTVVSLNYEKYSAEQKRYKAENKKLNDYLEKEIPGIDIEGLKEDAPSANDTIKIRKNNDWIKLLKKDIYLSETIQIMNEMK